jgi:GT2 family glycosyltransferase
MSMTDRDDIARNSAGAIATLCRKYREEGSLVDAQATLREGLTAHPNDVRLLVERVLLDNLSDQGERVHIEPERPTPSVEIIVCVHNALDDMKRCLDSILSKTTLPYSLIIVDDASTVDVRDFLNNFAESHQHVRLILNDKNLGYTKSSNRGLKAARADWVVLLNSDAIVTTSWLEGLINCALSDDAIAAVGPLSNAAALQTIAVTNNPSVAGEPEQVAEVVRLVSTKRYPRVPFLTGFCTLISLPALAAINYLNEADFPDYVVDVDMCLRLLRAGHKICVAENAYVHHASAASFGKGDKRDRLIAQGRQRLEELWPGFDREMIGSTINSALGDIKKAVSKELKRRAKEKGKPANRLLRMIRRYSRLVLNTLS